MYQQLLHNDHQDITLDYMDRYIQYVMGNQLDYHDNYHQDNAEDYQGDNQV
jgi:hypothetical protein